MKQEPLQAGATTATRTDAADLRYLRIAGHEAVRRVYAAVRASDWHTVPATVVVREHKQTADSFRIVQDVYYAAPERGIDFRAVVTLTGTPDGTITFDFDGEAFSTFDRARIGICVLHPAETKGLPITVTHGDGTTETGTLPDIISPHQPAFDIAALRATIAPGVEANITFSGEVFEMEDQRNWLDASFKTYSTPQSRPSPVTMHPGDKVRQTATVSPVGTVSATNAAPEPATVTVTGDTVGALPPVGRELPPMGNAFGVAGDFTTLNRHRPTAPFDAIHFGGNPQVHASDDLSLMETPATVAETIRTARTFANGKPVYVGQLRFGGGDDPRSTAPIGKAWYAAITYHALNAGAAGIATDSSNPIPLAALADATVRAVSVSDALRVAACAVAGNGSLALHLVNLLDAPQTVRIAGMGNRTETILAPYEIAIITESA